MPPPVPQEVPSLTWALAGLQESLSCGCLAVFHETGHLFTELKLYLRLSYPLALVATAIYEDSRAVPLVKDTKASAAKRSQQCSGTTRGLCSVSTGTTWICLIKITTRRPVQVAPPALPCTIPYSQLLTGGHHVCSL